MAALTAAAADADEACAAVQPPGGDVAARALRVRQLWRAAARHALEQSRSYEAAHVYLSPDAAAERCLRHSYDAVADAWSTTETLCRLETEPFAEGAMRRCYRLLKETQARGSRTDERGLSRARH